MIYFAKNIWPVLKKDIIEILAFLGILWTIKEVIEYILPKNNLPIKNFFILMLLVGIIVIVIKNRPKKEYPFLIKNKDIKLKLVVGDLLKQKASLIVPTNSTFDTKMEDDFISLNSVQGQIQNKYFKNNLKTLDILLEEGLKNREFKELTDRKNSKTKQYDIGTTVEINQQGKRFYFVADSNINAQGQTIAPSLSNITDALSRLWQYISEYGHVETIAIPIMGTGRMGIINSREEIIKQIIFSFVVNNNTKKIANELIICIRKEDIKKFNIDIQEIVEYLKFMCKFQYTNENTYNNIGIGIEK